MIKRIFLLILMVAITSGCSIYHLHSKDTSTYFLPAKKISDVVYLEDVKRPHEVIGYVTINAERRQKFDEILLKMKREAAVIGGDAITNIQTDSTGIWKRIHPRKFLKNAYIRANFTANIVVFK